MAVAFLTGLAAFVRVFAGLPLGWGSAVLDAAVIAVPVGLGFWLEARWGPAGAAPEAPAAPAETWPAAPPAWRHLRPGWLRLGASRRSGPRQGVLPSAAHGPGLRAEGTD